MDLTAQETNEQLPEAEAPPPTGMDNQQASVNKVPPHRGSKDDEEAAVRRFHVAASNFLQPSLRRKTTWSFKVVFPVAQFAETGHSCGFNSLNLQFNSTVI